MGRCFLPVMPHRISRFTTCAFSRRYRQGFCHAAASNTTHRFQPLQCFNKRCKKLLTRRCFTTPAIRRRYIGLMLAIFSFRQAGDILIARDSWRARCCRYADWHDIAFASLFAAAMSRNAFTVDRALPASVVATGVTTQYFPDAAGALSWLGATSACHIEIYAASQIIFDAFFALHCCAFAR